MAVMTMTQDAIEVIKVVVLVVVEEDDDAFPTVDKTTPTTKPAKLRTSLELNCSNFHHTATLADVMGSAALMVSTKAADAPPKPKLVAKNPMAKHNPANDKYCALGVVLSLKDLMIIQLVE